MSLAATLMDNFKPQALDFDSHEFRITEGGCLSAFQQQSARGSSWMTPETAEMARRSRGVNVQIPVINYEDVTIRTTRPVTITDAENTSQRFILSLGLLTLSVSKCTLHSTVLMISLYKKILTVKCRK